MSRRYAGPDLYILKRKMNVDNQNMSPSMLRHTHLAPVDLPLILKGVHVRGTRQVHPC